MDSDELIGDLCFVALRLARGAVRRDRFGDEYCNACVSTPNILHHPSCPAVQTIKLVERLYSLREEARLAKGGKYGAFFDPPVERHIEYGAPLVDPVLGELVEAEFTPQMMSHTEAAVLAAAGVPVEERRGILARDAARGAGGSAKFTSLGEVWAAASPVEGCAG